MRTMPIAAEQSKWGSRRSYGRRALFTPEALAQPDQRDPGETPPFLDGPAFAVSRPSLGDEPSLVRLSQPILGTPLVDGPQGGRVGNHDASLLASAPSGPPLGSGGLMATEP